MPVCELYTCSEPPVIQNTTRYYKDTDYSSAARYTCLPDFQHTAGDATRYCGDYGNWNGTDIQCTCKCITLSSPKGSKLKVLCPVQQSGLR